MENPTTWMGILGLVIMVILTMYRVRGAILIGIIFISITAWPRVNTVTYFPYTEAGDQMFDYFRKVVTIHPIDQYVYTSKKVIMSLTFSSLVSLPDSISTSRHVRFGLPLLLLFTSTSLTPPVQCIRWLVMAASPTSLVILSTLEVLSLLMPFLLLLVPCLVAHHVPLMLNQALVSLKEVSLIMHNHSTT